MRGVRERGWADETRLKLSSPHSNSVWIKAVESAFQNRKEKIPPEELQSSRVYDFLFLEISTVNTRTRNSLSQLPVCVSRLLFL